MLALLYLETRWAKNVVLQIARSPLRSTLWTLYLGFIALMLVLHLVDGTSARAGATLTPSLAIASAIGGGYACAVGIAIVVFAGGRIRAFRSPADARMLAQAPLSRSTVAFWLALRKLAAAATRWIPTLLFYALIAVSPRVGPHALGVPLLAVAIAAATFVSLELPSYLIARRIGSLPVQLAGALIATVGGAWFLFGIVTASQHLTAVRALEGRPWAPGPVVEALTRGNGPALLAFAVVPLTLVLVSVVLARNALPELYEASARTFAFVERRDTGRNAAFALSTSTRLRQGYVPPGAFVVVWKDWLGFRRSRGALAWWLALSVVSALVGLVVGPPMARDGNLYGPILFGTAVMFAFAVPIASSIDVSGDAAKPIWWLSDASLRQRLWALVLARSWRGAATIAIVPLIIGLTLERAEIVALAVPVTFALWWSLYAAGLALAVAFPNRLDSRGPLFVVRVAFAVAILVAPLGALYVSIGTGAAATAAPTVVVACAEAVALLEFATARLTRDAALLPAG